MHKNSDLWRSNWRAIITFFLLATTLSLIFRIYKPWPSKFQLPNGYGLNLFVALGPCIAAMISSFLFKSQQPQKVSLFGKNVVSSILFCIAPAGMLVLIGIQNKSFINEHQYALMMTLYWYLYVLGEEIGWRGYLQQIIKASDGVKAVLMGVCWYSWHLTFFLDKTSFVKEISFLFILICGSLLLIKLSKITISLLVSVGLHFTFSVITNITFKSSYIYGLLAVMIIWAIIIIKGYKEKQIQAK